MGRGPTARKWRQGPEPRAVDFWSERPVGDQGLRGTNTHVLGRVLPAGSPPPELAGTEGGKLW